MAFKFEEIPADKVEKQARGRKPSTTTIQLAEGFKGVGAGRAIVIKDLGVDPANKADKARVSSTIRQAARLANREVKIDFRVDGVPQVTFKR